MRNIRFRLAVALISLLALALGPAIAYADSVAVKVGIKRNMDAQLITPDGAGPFPAILLLHTSGGLQTADLDYAKRLAAEGYVVMVPSFLDAYGIRAKNRQLTFTSYAEPIYADFLSCLEDLKRNPEVDGKRLGAIGFSNGGYFALWLAAKGDIQAGVSYYGAVTGAATDKGLNRFREAFTPNSSPALILHGTGDSTVPVAKLIELDGILTSVSAPHAFYTYPGAEHRFERDGGAANDAAAESAWQKTTAFFRTYLQ